MDASLIAILAVGVSLAALVFSGQRAIRADLVAATAERQAIRQDLHALGERVARLEGAFPFLAARPETRRSAG